MGSLIPLKDGSGGTPLVRWTVDASGKPVIVGAAPVTPTPTPTTARAPTRAYTISPNGAKQPLGAIDRSTAAKLSVAPPPASDSRYAAPGSAGTTYLLGSVTSPPASDSRYAAPGSAGTTYLRGSVTAPPANPDASTAPTAGGAANPGSDPAPVGTLSAAAAGISSTLPPVGSALAPYGVTGATAAPAAPAGGGLSITDVAIIGGTLIALLVAVRTKGKK